MKDAAIEIIPATREDVFEIQALATRIWNAYYPDIISQMAILGAGILVGGVSRLRGGIPPLVRRQCHAHG